MLQRARKGVLGMGMDEQVSRHTPQVWYRATLCVCDAVCQNECGVFAHSPCVMSGGRREMVAREREAG
jgi:hypothetical protein